MAAIKAMMMIHFFSSVQASGDTTFVDHESLMERCLREKESNKMFFSSNVCFFLVWEPTVMLNLHMGSLRAGNSCFLFTASISGPEKWVLFGVETSLRSELLFSAQSRHYWIVVVKDGMPPRSLSSATVQQREAVILTGTKRSS